MSFPYLFHDVNFQKIPKAFKLFVKEFKLFGKENHSFNLDVTLTSLKKKILYFLCIYCKRIVLSLLLIEYLGKDSLEWPVC